MLAVGLVVSMTESATGHAADAGDFSIREMMDLLHLVAASAWGGGLLVLSFVILPHITISGKLATSPFAEVASRFSRIAGFSVGVLLITAVYNYIVNAGSIEALLLTPYGRIIVLKTYLFLLLIGFGAFNRYVSVPSLREEAGLSVVRRGFASRIAFLIFTLLLRSLKGHQVALRFKRIVRVEAFLIIGVLLCAAMLRHEIPARHIIHLQHSHVTGDHEHLHRPAGQEAFVHLETHPAKPAAGTPVDITVYIRDQNGNPLKGFIAHHGRILHAIIIGRDLQIFAHIHPEDISPITDEMMRNATFPLRFTFPRAGEYLVGLDFATGEGLYSKFSLINVTVEPAMGEPRIDFSAEKDFGEYRVSLRLPTAGIIAGAETTLRYLIKKNGKPVTDMEPYLGAPMHLAIVPSDLTGFIHTHGVVPGKTHVSEHAQIESTERFGPEIDVEILFPVKGIYKIFSQVNHQGKVCLFDFMVRVK
jgi:putative copper export protein